MDGRLGDAGRDGVGEAACVEGGAIVLIKASLRWENVGDRYRKRIHAVVEEILGWIRLLPGSIH